LWARSASAPYWYLTSHPHLLSLAIPLSVGEMSGSESWGVNSYAAQTEQGLTSHQTYYRSYQGPVFMDQMTKTTVSKHCRKIGPTDWASIPSGPLHRAHNNTTHMQYETKTHKINK